MKSEDYQSIMCLRDLLGVWVCWCDRRGSSACFWVLYFEDRARCEVRRGSGSLDEWPRSDSARVGIENDSTLAPSFVVEASQKPR